MKTQISTSNPFQIDGGQTRDMQQKFILPKGDQMQTSFGNKFMQPPTFNAFQVMGNQMTSQESAMITSSSPSPNLFMGREVFNDQEDAQQREARQRLEDKADQIGILREKFAVSLRKKRKQEILGEKREKMMQRMRLRDVLKVTENEPISPLLKANELLGASICQMIKHVNEQLFTDVTLSLRALIVIDHRINESCQETQG